MSIVTFDRTRMPEKPCATVFPNSFFERCRKAELQPTEISKVVIPVKEVVDINAKEEGKTTQRHEFFICYNNVAEGESAIANRGVTLDALFEFLFSEFDGRMVDILERGETKTKRVVVQKTVDVLQDEDLPSLVIYYQDNDMRTRF